MGLIMRGASMPSTAPAQNPSIISLLESPYCQIYVHSTISPDYVKLCHLWWCRSQFEIAPKSFLQAIHQIHESWIIPQKIMRPYDVRRTQHREGFLAGGELFTDIMNELFTNMNITEPREQPVNKVFGCSLPVVPFHLHQKSCRAVKYDARGVLLRTPNKISPSPIFHYLCCIFPPEHGVGQIIPGTWHYRARTESRTKRITGLQTELLPVDYFDILELNERAQVNVQCSKKGKERIMVKSWTVHIEYTRDRVE